METRITATELARNLSDILNRVRYRGESFRVERNGEVVAELRPAMISRGVPLSEFAAFWDGLAKPDPEFWDQVEEAHRIMNGPMPEPASWDS
jgi:antitoxin (DNA-binding transcriptional repressor) of toxin-antitoxin stability system